MAESRPQSRRKRFKTDEEDEEKKKRRDRMFIILWFTCGIIILAFMVWLSMFLSGR